MLLRCKTDAVGDYIKRLAFSCTVSTKMEFKALDPIRVFFFPFPLLFRSSIVNFPISLSNVPFLVFPVSDSRDDPSVVFCFV